MTLARRTPGERIAYLQGYTSALRRVTTLDDAPAHIKVRLLAELELQAKMLNDEVTAEERRHSKPNCPYPAHHDDCDCRGLGGDR